MSFILRSLRQKINILKIARRAKYALQKEKVFYSITKFPLIVNEPFVRSYAAAGQSYPAPSITAKSHKGANENFLPQIYFDIKNKGYGFKEDLIKAWKELESSTLIPDEKSAVLIRACGHQLPLETASDKLKLVKEIWDSFDVIGIKKTNSHYSALLKVYTELNHEFSPKDFLSDLKQKGVVPNLGLYVYLIHALAMQGKIHECKEYLEDMKNNSIPIMEDVFNSLILGYSLQGDYKSAQGILKLLNEKRLYVSIKSYTSLALGYAKQGNIEKVKEILEECQNQNIKLFPRQLLELAYTFAVNGHSEHFSSILDMIELEKKFLIFSTPVVHRLLHENLDKEALLILESYDKLNIPRTEQIQMFLNHYVKFREPSDVLKVAEICCVKGWTQLSLAYCLKETLLRKDVSHCLNFIQTMHIKGYPLRVHFFYPIIIKAREQGNKGVLKMIRHMKRYSFRDYREMVKYLNKFYNFLPGEEMNDLEKLVKAGLDERLVAWKILDTLLFHKDIDNAVKLVNSYGVDLPFTHLPVALAGAFVGHEGEHKKFVYIMRYLIHNAKVIRIASNQSADVSPVDYESFIINAAKTCDKTFIFAVMKEMLKTRIPISQNAGSFISEVFASQETADLVAKLTASDFKLEYDETILKRLHEFHEPRKPELHKKSFSELYEILKNSKDKGDLTRLLQDLASKTEFNGDNRSVNLVEKIFKFVSLQGDVRLTEEIYKIGVKKNLIEAFNFTPCSVAYLVSGNAGEALRRFDKGLRETGSATVIRPLIKEIIKRNDFATLRGLEASLSKVFGRNAAATKLVHELAKLEKSAEARKILLSEIEILKPWFDAKCKKEFERENLTYLETLEKASRNITHINTKNVYHYLLKLYERKQNLEKILNLFVTLDRDDSMSKGIQDSFRNILNNWSGEVPEEFENVLQCIKEQCAREYLQNTGAVSSKENIKNFEEEGTQSSCDKDNKFISSFNNANIFDCFCLIHTGQVKEYLNILRQKISDNEQNEARGYFFGYKLCPYVKRNKEYLDEYGELAIMCKSVEALEKYFKLSMRFGNFERICKVMEKLTPRQIRFSLRTIRIKDCKRAVAGLDRKKRVNRKIAILYSKILEHYIREKNLVEVAEYYKRAKELKLESYLTSWVKKDLEKLEKTSLGYPFISNNERENSRENSKG